MTTKPDLSPESIQRMLEIAEKAEAKPIDDKSNPSGTIASVELTRHMATFDPPTVRAILDEIVRLRKQLAPKKPSGLMAALCKDVERAQKEGERRQRLTAHRNRALPQEPPEET